MVEGIDSRAGIPKKPALLKGGMVFAWIYAGVLAVYLWMQPVIERMAAKGTLPGAAPFAEDTTLLVSARAFMIPLLVVSILVAYGLAKDRHWSRWTMMMMLVLGVVLIPPPLANPTNYLLSIALAGFGWWYLYRKSNVVEYYAGIRQTGEKGD